jgi:predicted metalloprotease with PDZ domain
MSSALICRTAVAADVLPLPVPLPRSVAGALLAFMLLAALPALSAEPAPAGEVPKARAIALEVDLRDAPRRRLLVHEVFQVAPGRLLLRYPKWIPGEHAPNGPINGVTGLTLTAAGKTLTWRRDPVDMYGIELEVPTGVAELELQFQFLAVAAGAFGGVAATTPHLLELEWNQVLFYPAGSATRTIPIAAAVRLPVGWQCATALEPAKPAADAARFEASTLQRFEPTTLEQLVDSPLIAGEYFRRIDLAPGTEPAVRLNLVADRAASLELKPEQLKATQGLVKQTLLLTDSVHYRHYDFLLALSDYTGRFGLEHQQSSDNRAVASHYSDPDSYLAAAPLLPHEFFHSWNGKFRRPKGLVTTDYQQPMKDGLLWVYEGLTNYYGEVLAARAGLWTAEQFRDRLAMTAAAMQYQPGRRWRPLQDTADAAQLLYGGSPAYANWRRGVDFYPEGSLLWLDIDTRLRTLSLGHKSLDDFVRVFHGAGPGAVEVLPYDVDDVVHTLEQLAPADWKGTLQTLLQARSNEAPLEGLRRAGWSLTFGDIPSGLFKATEKLRKEQNQSYDLGLVISTDSEQDKGTIRDVLWEGPAFTAGLAPGMRLLAVNEEDYSPDGLRRAISEAAQNGAPIRLLVRDAGNYQTLRIDYRGGLRYPQLEALKYGSDLLEKISAPLH